MKSSQRLIFIGLGLILLSLFMGVRRGDEKKIFAEIIKVDESYIIVESEESGVYSLDVSTIIDLKKGNLKEENLVLGQNIEIIYTGDILEVHPAKITEIQEINIVDD